MGAVAGLDQSLPEDVTMLDRATFLRPIAHRGLHDAARIENTAPAFEAALAQGYGVECDLQAAVDGTPMVFHDTTLDRLMDASGRIDARSPSDLTTLRYRASSETILTLDQFLELCAGRGPLLVEIKSEWGPPNGAFLAAVARSARTYRGPIALMSFDPGVMAVMASLAPDIPRGIVATRFEGANWWRQWLSPERAARLTHLLEAGPAQVAFFAYQVTALPTPVTAYVRAVHGLPLFAWTVRSAADRAMAAAHADAPIFESYVP
jgi:glycerophosphoryl diester phosphodiesterase